MITTTRLLRNSLKLFQNRLRFADVQESRSVATQETTATTSQEEIPIHLRPYDKNKYEVPSTKLKVIALKFSSIKILVRIWLCSS